MKSIFISRTVGAFIALLALSCLTKVFGGAPLTLLSESFESANALSDWFVHTEGEGRVEVVDTGSGHWLRMDDRFDNSTFSQNSVSRQVDITGYSSLNLSFDFNRINDEWHSFGPNFDGISITVDGVLMHRFYAEYFTQGVNNLSLDPFIGSTADTTMLEIGFHQYDNFGAPYDGLEWDNIQLTGLITREIFLEPTYEIVESAAILDILVLLAPAPEEDLQLYLSTATGQLISSAFFPAGQTVAELEFLIDLDDTILGGPRTYDLRVTDGDLSSEPFRLTVLDDETAGLEINLPEVIDEGAGGTVSVFGRNMIPYNSISVQLESSHPELLSVPASIQVNADYSVPNGGVGTFAINPVSDPAMTGDVNVTITARYGLETATGTVTVLDLNTLEPKIVQIEGSLTEGSDSSVFQLYFNAQLDETAQVTLVVDDPAVHLSLTDFQVDPVPGTVQFGVMIDDDEELQGSRDFRITAVASFSSGDYGSSIPFTILDNDVAGFEAAYPEMAERGGTMSLNLRAVDAEGYTVAGYGDAVSIHLVDTVLDTETQLTDDLSFIDGTAGSDLSIPVSASGDRLELEEADGSRHFLGYVILYGEIVFSANSLTYDSSREIFYAVSGGSALPGHLHSVTPLNPLTLEIGDGIFLGNNPTVAAITFDNAYLYIAKRDAYSISRLNLDTLNVDQQFTLTGVGSWASYSFWPEQILTFPGDPQRVVVVQDATTSSYAAVHSYLNGVIQADYVGHDEMSLANGADPDIFYGFNYSDTGFNFRKYQLTATGFVNLEDKRDLISGGSTRIYGEDDWIFTNTGLIIDGAKMERVGEIVFPWSSYPSYSSQATAVEIDLERSRLYFAKDNELLVYEAQGYTLVGRYDVPVSGGIVDLDRYGDTGIALSTDAGEILFIESAVLVPTGEPADLMTVIDASPVPAQLGEPITFTGTVSNQGDVPARSASLVVRFSDGMALDGYSAGGDGSTLVSVPLGDLAPGASEEFSFTATPSKLTTLIAVATAFSLSPDVNYADNQSSILLNVGFDSTPNSVNVLELDCNDAAFDSVNGLVVLTTMAAAQEGVANKVIGVDPFTGLIVRSVALPGEGGPVRVSDDGSVLYVLSNSRNQAYRIDWENESYDATVSFSTSATDLEILSGTTDLIIVGTYSGGARVYDSGVLLPDGSGTYNGDQIELLPDPNLVFAYNSSHSGFESFKFEITGSGVQTLVETGGLLSGYSTSLKSDGYYIFSNTGKVVRADIMAIAGQFDASFVGGVGAIEPERALRRAYIARSKTIGSYDSETYLFIRSTLFDALPDGIRTLERWGEDGFVCVLTNGHVAIIRTDMIPVEASPIDLSVDLVEGEVFAESTIQVSGSAFTGQGIERVEVNGQLASTGDAFASWTATVELANGENTIYVVADPFGTGAPRLETFTVYYEDPARSQELAEASLWLTSQTGHIVSADQLHTHDTDLDGLSDLAEFLFGTDPGGSDPPVVKMTTDSDGTLMFYFDYRQSTTFTYMIATSTNLVEWETDESRVVYVGSPVAISEKPGYVRSWFKLSEDMSEAGFVKVIVPMM